MEPDPDAQLKLRLKNGEDHVLNEPMGRWQQPPGFVHLSAYRSAIRALDLGQETFVRVYQTRHRYTVQGKFSTWLFAIAANFCRNYLRRRQRWGEWVIEPWHNEDAELAEYLQTPDDSPDQAMMR